MEYAGYALIACLAAGWVFFDARRRMAPRYWAAASWQSADRLGWPLTWRYGRCVRGVARRRSARGSSCPFSSCAGPPARIAALWNLAFRCGLATIGVAWACVRVPALVTGLALKRSTTEHGPTGMLGAMATWFSRCETNRRRARLHLPRMRQGIFDRTAVLRRLRRLAGRERLSACSTSLRQMRPRRARRAAGAPPAPSHVRAACRP